MSISRGHRDPRLPDYHGSLCCGFPSYWTITLASETGTASDTCEQAPYTGSPLSWPRLTRPASRAPLRDSHIDYRTAKRDKKGGKGVWTGFSPETRPPARYEPSERHLHQGGCILSTCRGGCQVLDRAGACRFSPNRLGWRLVARSGKEGSLVQTSPLQGGTSSKGVARTAQTTPSLRARTCQPNGMPVLLGHRRALPQPVRRPRSAITRPTPAACDAAQSHPAE